MAASAKENILKKIKEALVNPVPLPFPKSEGDQAFFLKTNNDNLLLFAEEFSKLQGTFSFCNNQNELHEQLIKLIAAKGWKKINCNETEIFEVLKCIGVENYPNLPSCDVSITTCEALVARTGSMVLTTAQASGRTTSVYAPIHVCIAYTSQVVYDVADALQNLKDKYAPSFPSFVTFASGPSRTADIEKTLVTGVHGPKEVFCFLVYK